MTNSCMHNCGNNPFYLCYVERLQNNLVVMTLLFPVVFLSSWELNCWNSGCQPLALFCQLGKIEELTLRPKVLGTDSIQAAHTPLFPVPLLAGIINQS